jgi:hypothetical protein
MRKVWLLSALFAFFAVPAFCAEPTAEQWRADLHVLSEQLPRLHKNLFFTLPKTEFEQQVSQLNEAIPRLSGVEIRAALVRLLASVGNAHTSIDGFRDTPLFPVVFEMFPDGPHVIAAPREFPETLAARLIAVNGTPLAEVQRRLMPYFAKENDVAMLWQIPQLLRMAAPLKVEGVIPDMETARYQFEKDGALFEVTLRSATKFPPAEFVRATQPRANRQNRERGLDYWYEYLPDSHTMYVQYNACRDMKQQSFPDFTAEVMKALDGLAQPAERFVIDLRFNGGGSSRVIGPLIHGLKARRKLKVYALVGRYTFSSAFMNAMTLQSDNHATLVGEAMGQRPNGYGDIRPLTLPNSGLTAWYCTKYFRLAKGDPPQVEPDIKVQLTASDYFQGRDPALDYAVTH